MRPIRTFLVEDHEVVRKGISELVSRDADIRIVGTSASGEDALDAMAATTTDVAVVSYALPCMNGATLSRTLATTQPDVGVLIVSDVVDDDVVDECIDAGARGFVHKDITGEDLQRAVRVVHQGQAMFDPRATRRLIRRAQRQGAPDGKSTLSRRQKEVLRLVVAEMSNRQIADRIGTTENTVGTHLRRMAVKLETHSRGETGRVAQEHDLL